MNCFRKKKNYVFAVSSACLCTLSTPDTSNKILILSSLLALFAGFFLFGNMQFCYPRYRIYSLSGAAVCVYSQLNAKLVEGSGGVEGTGLIICALLSLLVLNGIYGYVYNRYFPIIFSWAKRHIWLVASMFMVSFAVAFAYLKLSYMFYGVYNGIFSMDSMVYIDTNTFSYFNAPENDIRQPLFGLVGGIIYGPFPAIWFISKKAYTIFLGMANSLLVMGGISVLSSVLRAEERKKFILFCAVSYPAMLFILCVEQYPVVFLAAMWLLYEINANQPQQVAAYVGAAGSLVTTGIFLPIGRKGKFLDVIKTGKCIGALAGMLVICGRMQSILDLAHLSELTTSYTDTGGFENKLMQYSNFIRAVFIAPATKMAEHRQGVFLYSLTEVTTFSAIGITILLVCFLSALMNRKDRIVRISWGWSIYSFLVLGVLGYGTGENILVLYSLYYGWGYWVLLFTMLRLPKKQKLRDALFYCVVTLMAVINLYGIWDIVRLGAEYYPV